MKKLSRLYKNIRNSIQELYFRIKYKSSELEIRELFKSNTMEQYHHVSVALRFIYIVGYVNNNQRDMNYYIEAHRNYYKFLNKYYDEERDVKNFNKLIESFLSHGYNPKSALYMDLDGNLYNGAHRLALCIYSGNKVVTVKRINRHVVLPTVSDCISIYNVEGIDERLNNAFETMKTIINKGSYNAKIEF